MSTIPDPPPPESAGLAPGGPEGAPLSWEARGTRRLNRLRAVVAKALLSTGDSDESTAERAIGFLRRVVDGDEPATMETRAQAAGTLARAAVSMAKEPKGGPTVDARSVTLHIGSSEAAALPAGSEAVRAALEAFRKASTGGDPS